MQKGIPGVVRLLDSSLRAHSSGIQNLCLPVAGERITMIGKVSKMPQGYQSILAAVLVIAYLQIASARSCRAYAKSPG